MLKTKAIELLGGNITAAASAIGISYQAVNQWPDVLTKPILDRVQAALYRKHLAEQALEHGVIPSAQREVSHG